MKIVRLFHDEAAGRWVPAAEGSSPGGFVEVAINDDSMPDGQVATLFGLKMAEVFENKNMNSL